MRIHLFHIIGALAIVTVLHSLAVRFDLYAQMAWLVDGPLHVASGIILGMFWLFALRMFSRTMLELSPAFLVAISIAGFALFGSFVWELLEFSLWKLLPEYAMAYQLFSPTPTDLLSDMGFGFLGGVIMGLFYYFKEKEKIEEEVLR